MLRAVRAHEVFVLQVPVPVAGLLIGIRKHRRRGMRVSDRCPAGAALAVNGPENA